VILDLCWCFVYRFQFHVVELALLECCKFLIFFFFCFWTSECFRTWLKIPMNCENFDNLFVTSFTFRMRLSILSNRVFFINYYLACNGVCFSKYQCLKLLIRILLLYFIIWMQIFVIKFHIPLLLPKYLQKKRFSFLCFLLVVAITYFLCYILKVFPLFIH
jgi:hypothetical protein